MNIVKKSHWHIVYKRRGKSEVQPEAHYSLATAHNAAKKISTANKISLVERPTNHCELCQKK